MIPEQLRYHRPRSLDEAIGTMLAHDGDIRVLSGGTSLVPRMTRGEIKVGHVLDIRGLGIDRIGESDDGGIEVGAMVTYADLIASPLVATRAPVLATVARGITGGRQLTQQATLVGSACFNFPSSDAPGVLAGLGAQFRVAGPQGVRTAAASEFFLDAYRVDLRRGEIVTGVRIPGAARGGYCKIKHSAGSWPIATATAVFDGPDAQRLRVSLGAVAAVPLVVTVDDPARLADDVTAGLGVPWSDVLAPASYRASIAPVAARRAADRLMEIS